MPSWIVNAMLLGAAYAYPVTVSLPEDSWFTVERAKTAFSLESYVNSCNPEFLMNKEYTDYLEGFEPQTVIEEPIWGAQCMVGYLPSADMIYVTHRAASNSESAAADLDMPLTPFLMWPECNCRVHRGY
jgi:hypothetical protein